MLPVPALTFTIPSIHDDIVLDCRVYFPSYFSTSPTLQIQWRKKAAIVAHPYAPLGGCYDDPVVEVIVSGLLKAGFVVGTFNFRGAGTSKGRTSWTSKPEIKDYISMIGFMIYLMNELSRPHNPCDDDPFVSADDINSHHLSPVPSHVVPPPHTRDTDQSSTIFTSETQSFEDKLIVDKRSKSSSAKQSFLMLLAGYSYGALITTQLPEIHTIKDLFSTPVFGSAPSEIRLRAQQLAKQQNEIFVRLARRPESESSSAVNVLHSKHVRGHSLQTSDFTGARRSGAASSVRVGGEETDSDLRRASQDSHGRHSFVFETPERVRRSVDRVRSLSGRGPSSENTPRVTRRQTSSPHKVRHSGSFRNSSSIEAIKSEDPLPSIKINTADNMPLTDLGDIKTAYLLISPLHGLVTNLATMWSFAPQTLSKRKNSRDNEAHDDEGKLITNDTLAIFGDRDVFTSSKRLRSWATRLSTLEKSRFIYAEISGAGHFWHEDGVIAKMKGAINEFVSTL